MASVWTVQADCETPPPSVQTTTEDCVLPTYTAQLEPLAPDIRGVYCNSSVPVQKFIEFSVREAIFIDPVTFSFVSTCFPSILNAFGSYMQGVKPTCADNESRINPMHVVTDFESKSFSVTNWAPTQCIPLDSCDADSFKTYMGKIFIESNKAFNPCSTLNDFVVADSFATSAACVKSVFNFQRNPQGVCDDSAPQCDNITFFDITIASGKSFTQPICIDGCLGKDSALTKGEMNRILELRGNGYREGGENPYCVSEDDSMQVKRSEKQPVFKRSKHCTAQKLDRRLGGCEKCRDITSDADEFPAWKGCDAILTTKKKKKRHCKRADVNTRCARACGKCCYSDMNYKFAFKDKKKGCAFINNERRKKKYCKVLCFQQLELLRS